MFWTLCMSFASCILEMFYSFKHIFRCIFKIIFPEYFWTSFACFPGILHIFLHIFLLIHIVMQIFYHCIFLHLLYFIAYFAQLLHFVKKSYVVLVVFWLGQAKVTLICICRFCRSSLDWHYSTSNSSCALTILPWQLLMMGTLQSALLLGEIHVCQPCLLNITKLLWRASRTALSAHYSAGSSCFSILLLPVWHLRMEDAKCSLHGIMKAPPNPRGFISSLAIFLVSVPNIQKCFKIFQTYQLWDVRKSQKYAQYASTRKAFKLVQLQSYIKEVIIAGLVFWNMSCVCLSRKYFSRLQVSEWENIPN